MWFYAFPIFLSAFLLFQVQPIIAKHILPWFGGTPAVWTTCMVFFQVALLGGYAYAHASIRLLTPRKQAILHGLLLASARVVPGKLLGSGFNFRCPNLPEALRDALG
jgi:hypothetical protein